jgi:hypothetical protein
MKKNIIYLLVIGLITLLLSSCLEKYLDKAPEAGLSEKEVFSTYENFKKYFNVVYSGYAIRYPGSTNPNFTGNKNYSLRSVSPFFLCTAQTFSYEAMSPMTDQGAIAGGTNIKTGLFNEFWKEYVCYRGNYPMLASMFICIRVSNTTISKIKMLKDASQEDIDDLLAQAYFVRGYSHFELLKRWGGMPYITKVIGQDDQWDMVRLSPYETLMKVIADMDTAKTYFEKAGRARPQQSGRGVDRRSRIGELVERVPNGHDVERSTGVERSQLAVVYGESHRTREPVDLGVDVETFELKAFFTRGGEKCADVAPDLEACAATTEESSQRPSLRSHRRQLRRVQ